MDETFEDPTGTNTQVEASGSNTAVAERGESERLDETKKDASPLSPPFEDPTRTNTQVEASAADRSRAKTVALNDLNDSPLAPEPTWDEWHRFRDEYNNDAMTWFRAHGIGAPEQLQVQIQMVEFGVEEWMKKR